MLPSPPGNPQSLPPPVLAKETSSLPTGEDWIYELWWSGERVRAVKDEGGVRLLSREGRNLANRFPRVAAAVAKLRPENAVIDGEILLLDGYSAPAVKFLANVSDDISQAQVALLAYDLLQHHGEDMRHLPLLGRRVVLASLIQGTPIILSPLLTDSPDTALARAEELGLRGVVAKRAGSSYRPNALCNSWMKVLVTSAIPEARRPRVRGSQSNTPFPFQSVAATPFASRA